MNPDDRYPLAVAALHELLGRGVSATTPGTSALATFRLGPSVLRAPPAVRARPEPGGEFPIDGDDDGDTGDLLGELVDMVLVGADDSDSRHPEVHLQFKAEVLGGLHLRLQKTPDGLVATFHVADAAARRAVIDHVDALLAHLQERGFSIARHSVDVAPR